MQPQPDGYPTQPAVAPPQYLPQYLYPNPFSSPYPNPNPTSAVIGPYASSATAASVPPYSDATSSQTYDASYYAQSTVYSQASGDATSASGYYQDPTAQNWALAYAASVASNVTQQLVASQVKSNPWKDAAMRKLLKKRKNPVQHAWCDMCKIQVTSTEILNSHKQGKKHQKNLEKLKTTLAPASGASKEAPKNSIIGPQENPNKRKLKEPEVDLETKKKKVVAGGAKVHSVRTCEICNVVCNSDVVFRFHLAGQKHIAMVKGRMGP